jgi:hypothetical protein
MSGNTTTHERRDPMQKQQGGTRQMSRSSSKPVDDTIAYVRTCVRENPEAAALWCLGIGFVLGWKLKPW